MSRESEFAKRHPVVIMVYVLACMIWTMVVRHPAAIVVSFVGASVFYVALAGIIRWLQLWIPAGMMLVFAAVILFLAGGSPKKSARPEPKKQTSAEVAAPVISMLDTPKVR